MGKTKGEFLFGEAASDKTRLGNQAPSRLVGMFSAAGGGQQSS